MTNFGTDVPGVDDVDPSLPLISGPQVVAYACARRLSSPSGSVHYDPEAGTWLGQWIGSTVSPAEVEAAIRAECLKDERVDSVSVSVTLDGETLTVEIHGETAFGPFDLTGSAGEVVEVIVNGT